MKQSPFTMVFNYADAFFELLWEQGYLTYIIVAIIVIFVLVLVT